MKVPFHLHDERDSKAVLSPNYNYYFNKETGFFIRCGKTASDDPEYAPFGPEIADIEVSTICTGINGVPCAFCYKGNTGRGENMSIETYTKVLDKYPKVLTQVALGIGDIDSNPDLWKIMEYTRLNGVVPNVTINGWNLTDDNSQKLKELCGAVAVSCYEPHDVCYDAVKKLTDLGMEQINIHFMLSAETYDRALKLLEDCKTDPRLAKLRAIVFLSLKKKGRAKTAFNTLESNKYQYLVNKALDENISIGFDSCGAYKFFKSIQGTSREAKLLPFIEPCESTLFSSYVNVKGEFFPCSFIEDEIGFKPIDIPSCRDFLKDVWYHPDTESFRNTLINTKCEGCRRCPVFEV